MDNLAKRLRDDAERIECTVSEELDERIRASLHGITPEAAAQPAPRSKSFSFWFVSSLTGVAAAATIIAVVNLRGPGSIPETTNAVVAPLNLPTIQWHVETVDLTSPLEQEIDDLQSDLKKAEEAVKQDIDRLF